jgi:hypothetical protein
MSLLEPGQTLRPGHSLYSENGNYSLWMQTDGNVVLYYGHDSDDPNFAPSDAHWATHTGPGQFTPSGLIMQTDGNLVLYDTSNQARWASGTSNHPGAYLNMQDDGNVVVYPAGAVYNNALWATNTVDHTPPPTGGIILPEPEDGDEEGAGESPEDRR